jgi:hypothetical protein
LLYPDDPPQSVVRARLWWLASELVARHRELHVIANPPPLYFDRYTVLRPWGEEGLEGLIEFASNGGIHTPQVPDYEIIRWRDVMRTADPLDTVRTLEKAVGLHRTNVASPSDPKLVCYRAVAQILAEVVNDTHEWVVKFGVAEFFDPESMRPELELFPSLAPYLQTRRTGEVFGNPAYRVWLIYRDGEPVAALDVDGHLHQQRGPQTDLVALVERAGSLAAAVDTGVDPQLS